MEALDAIPESFARVVRKLGTVCQTALVVIIFGGIHGVLSKMLFCQETKYLPPQSSKRL